MLPRSRCLALSVYATLVLSATLIAACSSAPDDDDQAGATETPTPAATGTPVSPTPPTSPVPGSSPTPQASPSPDESPPPDSSPTPLETPPVASPTPLASPSPDESPPPDSSPTPAVTPTPETGAPVLEVDPALVDFGSVSFQASEPALATVTLSNAGDRDLSMDLTVLEPAGEEVYSLESLEAGSVAPGASLEVQIAFAPTAAESYTGTLLIRSNDPARMVVTVPLSGEGVNGTDADHDGVTDGDGDCDDNEASVYPGALEVCDHQDNDCDGKADEGFDHDLDGYSTCALPVADCDDDNPAVRPGIAEACDQVDSDCDGELNNGFDFDGDGTADCTDEDGDGVTELDGDCDDTRKTISPRAEEVCDSLDNDCDGSIDEADAIDATTWYLDADGDSYGSSSSSLVACDAPAGYVGSSSDCDDDAATRHPGAAELCDGTDNDCDDTADEGASCPCTLAFYQGDPYMFCTTKTSWEAARTKCYAYGYHMVTVNASEEDEWLKTTLKSIKQDDWWLGFTDAALEGTYVWEDGSPTTYTNWQSGQPDNYQNEDCGVYVTDYAFKWGDGACSGNKQYICEAN